jgi:hypothetical protein
MNVRNLTFTFVLTAFFFPTACKKSNPETPIESIQSVSFLNKGAVVPLPTRTLVSVNQDSITFLATQNGTTINYMSSLVAANDFSHLVSIVTDNNLWGAPDPALPAGQMGCVGTQGMTIVMTKETLVDTLNISGPLFCDSCQRFWPTGLSTLVTFEDSLVGKYFLANK